MDKGIAVFKGKAIRRSLHNNEWWFSIVDIIEALTETDRPRKYWSDLKTKLVAEGYAEVSEKIGQLKMQAPDGKMRETDCANGACGWGRSEGTRSVADLMETVRPGVTDSVTLCLKLNYRYE